VQTDLTAIGRLDFEAPDLAKFPALVQARRAGEIGGTLPAVLNAANEVAVDAFCDRQVSFPGISEAVGQVMDRHEVIGQPSFEQILQADEWARETARDILALGQSKL
jgi:1-deoxy-D-xylulose-5-phosphate reductoisomerase